MYKRLSAFIFGKLRPAMLSGLSTLPLMGVLVVFEWEHLGAFDVSSFNIYRGANVASLQKIGSVPAPITGAGVYTFEVEFDSATPQLFGVSAVNALGESPITTTGPGGAPVLLGKPQSPAALKWSARP